MGTWKSFLQQKKCGRLRQAVRRGCSGGDGAGPVCVPAHRHHFGYPGGQLGAVWLVEIGAFAKAVSGPAMAISIGFALQAPPLVLFSLAAVGWAANALGGAGGPLAVLAVSVTACELGKLVSKETPVDILVTPLVTILSGAGSFHGSSPPPSRARPCPGAAHHVGHRAAPFLMGIVVSVLGGIFLTLPISSAAICHALSLTGLAGGAAVAGCCAQMVGFAVLSFRENRWGGLVSQGLGTSMLQMGNIVRNPRIWLPAILTSAVTGPIATCLFHLEMNGPAISSGMGTCGLVGQIGVYSGWVAGGRAITLLDWAGLLLISVLLPAVVCWGFGLLFRKIGWIREGDLTLN